MFQFEPKGGEKADAPVWRQSGRRNCLLLGGESGFFVLGLQLIGWGPPTPGRAVCFIQSSDRNVNLIQKHSHRHTQKNVQPNNWPPCGPVQLTHKIHSHTHCSDVSRTERFPKLGLQGYNWKSPGMSCPPYIAWVQKGKEEEEREVMEAWNPPNVFKRLRSSRSGGMGPGVVADKSKNGTQGTPWRALNFMPGNMSFIQHVMKGFKPGF